MRKHNDANSINRDATKATLRRENEILSQQVKRLIKAEGKLYQYQEELDAQLKEYKNLYELNRKLNRTFNIGEIFEYTLSYVVQNLEYERAVLFQRREETGKYHVCAIEGYYDEQEKSCVAQLAIEQEASFLSPLIEGREYLICRAESKEPELAEYRAKLRMNEYFVYPLGTRSRPHALLAVGNSAENAEFYRKVSDSSGTLLSMGNLVGLVSSLIENYIFYNEKEKALEHERLAEAKYRSIFENAVEGIFQRTPAGQYLDANPSLARMLGYASPQELMANVTDIGHQLYVLPERHIEFTRLLEEHDVVEAFETQLYRKDGGVIWASLNARAVRDQTGRLLYYEGTAEKITERKRAEEALRESERKFHAIFDQSYQFIGLLALDGTVVEANRTALQFIGIDESTVIGQPFWETPWWTHSTDLQDQVCTAVKKAAGGEFVRFEATHRAADGTLHYVDFSLKPVLDETGNVALLIPEGRDITERKMIEEQLRTSLTEKEILLKEVHHRVKNNLQVISSMLHLQSARVTDEEVLMAFRESQSRVDTMALIHAKLYQSGDLTNVPFRSYIGELITNLYISFGVSDETVKAVIDVADVTLNVNTAIPCGLIINELVTNCLKHAFPGNRTGEIVVSMRQTADGRYVLAVGDNGVGFPEDTDFRKTGSLGLKLVNSLTSQLDGTIELARNGGTTFTIRFAELIYRERG
jgi:PAS domain S-box-containing protein